VDASKKGIGAYSLYLFQKIPNVTDNTIEERVVESYSRSVPESIQNYDSRELEMLAVVEALEHFKPIFEGHHVLIESDHRNLPFLRNCKGATGKLGRWCMRLETFGNELRYRAGKDQQVADCLSRNPIDEEIELDADGAPASLRIWLRAQTGQLRES